MTLPNFFLADLPPEATLTPDMLSEACLALRRNRERYLAPRPTARLVALLAELGENWLQPDYPFRRLALELGPAALGFAPPTLARGLDGFFQQLTADNLHALLGQDLGQAARLDGFQSTAEDARSGRAALVTGPELLFHITAGNLPVGALHSLVLGLLVRSAQFVKCARGQALLPRLFAHSIYETDPKLGACLELAEWPGGNTALEDAVFTAADCVTATGSDETLAALRPRVPGRTRWLGYGHRVSFAYVCAEMLDGFQARKCAQRAAADIAAWNQLGCLSPHVVYVERRGAVMPEEFAELLAQELAKLEAAEPRGPLAPAEAAAIASRRAFYEVRAAHSPDTRLWASEGSTAWTVLYEAEPQFQPSCLNRFAYVKGVEGVEPLLAAVDTIRGKVSTVGLAAPPERAAHLATTLARWGVTRLCPLGRMQEPPLTWRHDGRPSLGDLVTWADWEKLRWDFNFGRQIPDAGCPAERLRLASGIRHLTSDLPHSHMKMELRKTFQFEAAHLLPLLPKNHKCRRLHGHSFAVEIAVAGDCDPRLGWLMDYADLSQAFRPIWQKLDHRYLNEVRGLENPTSENVAAWIWRRLKPKLPLLTEIVVAETCTARCIYRGG